MTKRPWPPPAGSRPTQRPAPAGPSGDEAKAVAARFNAGRFREAEALGRSLAQRYPAHPFGWKVVGAALKQQGRLEESLPAMRQAADLARIDPEAFSNLGIVLLHLGRLAEAETALRRALELKSDYAQVHSNLGAVLLGQGRPAEAEIHYRRTVKLAPDYAEAYNNLAITLFDQGRLPEANAALRQAVALAPDYVEAHATLGAVLGDQARQPQAATAHRRAWTLAPGSLRHAIRARLLLPVIEESRETIQASRQRYEDGIAALADVTAARLGATESINLQSFYLAYHDADDRRIIEALGRRLKEKAPNLTATAPYIAGWRAPGLSGRRLKVGFLSKYFSFHTIWKVFRGYVQHLDRSRFEVVVIHTNKSRPDDARRELDALADRSIVLPRELDDQQKAIAAEELDVLFYPDIGMTSSAYFLAHARLAPVQAVGWGHPDTTGLATVDYYVSAAAMEPDDADEHYTERLIRLGRMPSCYTPPAVPDPLPPRVSLGLPETGTLYGCSQSLFKFHPDFDAVLAEIAAGDLSGHFILAEGADPNWSRLLRQRWQRTAPILQDRAHFLSYLSPGDFVALLAHIDVGLDTVHFGGGNTFYEAMASGMPTVTWPGRFMRGRITAGAYRQMGLAEAPVVERLEDYAPLALALGRDPERRRALRQAFREAARRELFEDMTAVREFELFLEATVTAAARGEKLERGWRAPMP